ncbi:hypothetical protein [Luteibacter yeojuensis]
MDGVADLKARQSVRAIRIYGKDGRGPNLTAIKMENPHPRDGMSSSSIREPGDSMDTNPSLPYRSLLRPGLIDGEVPVELVPSTLGARRWPNATSTVPACSP